jgi:hypothetical protein
MKWIFKITTPTRPHECCIWYGGTTHKYPETQFTFFIKDRYKKYSEKPVTRGYRPYFPFVKDGNFQVNIIGKTALEKEDELIKYCDTLTIILNRFDLPQNIPTQIVC